MCLGAGATGPAPTCTGGREPKHCHTRYRGAPISSRTVRSANFCRILATREFPNSTSEARNYTRSKIRRLVRQDSKNKYILVVGTLEPRKNYDLILRAFEQARRVRKSLSLVLVAHPGWRFDNEIRTINKLSEVWNVHHLWKVPIDELRFLYSGALAVVCASRNEGFDSVRRRSDALRNSVLASDIPVHRWVYDKHALYFNPYDGTALSAAFWKLPKTASCRLLYARQARPMRRVTERMLYRRVGRNSSNA